MCVSYLFHIAIQVMISLELSQDLKFISGLKSHSDFKRASYFLPDTWGFDGKYRASSRSEARSSFLALLLRCLVALGQVSKLTPGVLLQLVCVVSPMTMKWKAILRNSSGSSSGGWSGWRLVYVAARGKWALKCQ